MTTTQTQVTGPVDDAIDDLRQVFYSARNNAGRTDTGTFRAVTADESLDFALSAVRDHITARLTPRAPMPDDTEQLDDQVQDVLHTNLMTRIDRYTGLDEESVAALAAEIEVQFRKDLASLGILLTYDTTGGER